jgi:hypothetical protein
MMGSDPPTFHTATMAKILADQNKLEDSARIYRLVLQSHPENIQLRRALQAVERELVQSGSERFRRLANKWVDLLLNYNHLINLNKSGHRIDRQR